MTTVTANDFNIKLYGERVALMPVEEDYSGSIQLPDGTNSTLGHELGKIKAVGDCRVKDEQRPIFVNAGDVVLFQMNQMLAGQCLYRWQNKHLFMVLLQSDMIARLKSTKITLEGFEILGNWILLEPFATPKIEVNGAILIPDNVQNSKDRLRVIQLGSTVDLDVKVGDEVVPAKNRCNPIRIDGDDYVYIDKSSLAGVISEA